MVRVTHNPGLDVVSGRETVICCKAAQQPRDLRVLLSVRRSGRGETMAMFVGSLAQREVMEWPVATADGPAMEVRPRAWCLQFPSAWLASSPGWIEHLNTHKPNTGCACVSEVRSNTQYNPQRRTHLIPPTNTEAVLSPLRQQVALA